MRPMTRTAATLATTITFGLVAAAAQQSTAPRPSPPPSLPLRPAAARTLVPVHEAPLDRALLDKYCVACHNEKLKTAGLMLDKIDLAQPGAQAELLEKVIRKVSTGQMPPAGRPQPDKASADQFVSALEAALDQAAAGAPNPGRVAVHRLNRLEYINAVHDLLALDIDPSLLPADNGGVGFDNNADILSITPALMNRYMSAATKVSRLAIGDPAIRPAIQLYKASDWATQTGRSDEDLPFGARGGFVVKHPFPLDGEYEFKIRLQRNFFGGTIHGIDDEHEIEVRIDGALIKRFKVGGKYKGADAGILIAIPEDDVEGKKLHAYHLDADDDFNFRLPVKAGSRTIAASFTDKAPGVDEMVPLRARSIKSATFDDASAPSIGTIEVSGPHNAKAPDDTLSRRQIFVCRPATAREDDACARRIVSTLARRAYRRPVTDADTRELMELYAAGRQDGNFDAGIGRALEGLLSMPAFLFRLEQDPADARPGQTYRVSDLELASRLSFFLWKSIPDDELLDVATRGRLKEPAVLSQQVRRMLADGKASRWMNDFVGQWLQVRNLQAMEPDAELLPELRRQLARGDDQGDLALLREPGARRSAGAGPVAVELHVPQSAAGASLRYRQRLRQSLPPRADDRSGTAGPARTGQRVDGVVVRAPHVGRPARQVGARESAGHAAATAAAQRAAAERE